jgi:hypothetical protein
MVHTEFSTLGLIVMGIITLFALSTLTHVFPLMAHVRLKTSQLFLYAVKLNLLKPYLTLLNLVALWVWFSLSIHHALSILMITLFFSISAVVTYWVVDQKFKTIVALQNGDDTPASDAVDEDADEEGAIKGARI